MAVTLTVRQASKGNTDKHGYPQINTDIFETDGMAAQFRQSLALPNWIEPPANRASFQKRRVPASWISTVHATGSSESQ
jgi:hypothetical protein